MVIDHGEIVASDTADNLKAAVSGDQVDLEVARTTRSPARATELAIHRATTSRSTASTSADGCPRPARRVPGLLRDLDRPGIELDSIEVHRPTLDDVFLTLTGRSLRDAETEKPETARPRRSRPVSFVRESTIVFRRQVRMNLRNPAWVLIGMMQPVLYLVLFGPLLKPIVDSVSGAPDNAYTFLVPGPAGAAGHVRRVLRRVRPDRRVARGSHRGRAGHPGQPDGAAGRPARAATWASCSCRP